MSHSHSHEGASHSHEAADHGHTHEILDGPGSYLGRELPIIEGRDWEDRSFTIGIGGYDDTRVTCTCRYTARPTFVCCRVDMARYTHKTLTSLDR
jgi:hypothetical protein